MCGAFAEFDRAMIDELPEIWISSGPDTAERELDNVSVANRARITRCGSTAKISPEGEIVIEFAEPGNADQSDKLADDDWDRRLRELREQRQKESRSKRT